MKRYTFGLEAFLRVFWLFILINGIANAGEKKSFNPYVHDKPFEAEVYKVPPPPKSHLSLQDNGDGTIADPDAGLMWAKADSYADLKKCLNWHDSKVYVKNLTTGSYNDWRLPTLDELSNLHDNTKENLNSMDHDPKHPLGLDEKFSNGSAYWSWSSDYHQTNLTDCCTRIFYFVTGMSFTRRLSECAKGGVRAVRSIKD